mmetsp:Transcript_3471/g.9924  ORF Transcript_3471/g.9924 Transcript_3471/m.9924 type:complete len:273 (-) Transcript_3471:19-837(-)
MFHSLAIDAVCGCAIMVHLKTHPQISILRFGVAKSLVQGKPLDESPLRRQRPQHPLPVVDKVLAELHIVFHDQRLLVTIVVRLLDGPQVRQRATHFFVLEDALAELPTRLPLGVFHTSERQSSTLDHGLRLMHIRRSNPFVRDGLIAWPQGSQSLLHFHPPNGRRFQVDPVDWKHGRIIIVEVVVVVVVVVPRDRAGGADVMHLRARVVVFHLVLLDVLQWFGDERVVGNLQERAKCQQQECQLLVFPLLRCGHCFISADCRVIPSRARERT